MKKKLMRTCLFILFFLTQHTLNANVLFTSSSGGSLILPKNIALTLSKNQLNHTHEKLYDITAQDIEKFLLYMKDAQQKLAEGKTWRKIIEELSEQSYVTQADELCKLLNLSVMVEQPYIGYALGKKYIFTHIPTREVLLYREYPLLNESKILLRKLYFLHRNDPSVMTVDNPDGNQSFITLTLPEIIVNRPVYIENSKVNLSHHFLSSLDGISFYLNLPQTQQLDISHNLLRSLPAEIGSGKYLKRIDVSNNQLEYLPDALCTLHALENIDVKNNALQTLPEHIGNLKKLIRLNADNNALTKIPDSIGECEELRWLDLADNNLEELPATLSRAKNLSRVKANKEVLQKVTSKNE